MLTLADVLEALTAIRPEGAKEVITEAVIDSRQVIPGSMFVALPGERVDGHDFIGPAFERGARLALVQKDLSESYPTMDIRGGSDSGRRHPAYAFLLVGQAYKSAQQVARFLGAGKRPVVGITGSVGKSTTKELVAEVLVSVTEP
jgi:UDP-N-acetylmuramoyl-tripeptide--D-alanyl-D-alanine ligase